MKNFGKIGTYLVLLSLVFNIIETAYFGFNARPMSRPEEICDTVSQLMFNFGFTWMVINFLYKKDGQS